ncbi:dynamin family protein [uncultured Veillonella sp.]|uniref:dynamin family protein n=1 Tax=uncultured Veillonella sp. TaxID=159268 RepID=UPI0025F231F0|nr:dynamin family protein [uncultured Veillonella sp.]
MTYDLMGIMHSTIEQLKQLERLIERDREIFYDDEISIDKVNVQELADSMFSPLQIMVMGAFSTGKSSFINALLGENLTVVGALPTTAVITKLVYGPEAKVVVHFKNKEQREYDPIEFRQLTAEQEDAWLELHRQIDYVTYEVPIELLKSINIIDSPGLDALNEHHMETTKQFIRYADTVLWIMSAEAALTTKELAHIEQLEGRMKPLVIVNKIDTIDEEEDSVEDIIDEVERKLKHRVQAVLPVSAQLALEGKLKTCEELLEDSLLPQVETYIKERIIPHSLDYKMDKLINTISFMVLKVEWALGFYRESSYFDMTLFKLKKTPLKGLSVQAYRRSLLDIIQSIQLYCEEQSLEGKAESLGFMGLMYLFGYAYFQDTEKGITYLEYAAMKQNSVAQGLLFVHHYMVVIKHLQEWQQFYLNKKVPFNLRDLPSYDKAVYWAKSFNTLDITQVDSITKHFIEMAHEFMCEDLLLTEFQAVDGARELDVVYKELRQLLSQDEAVGIYSTLPMLGHLHECGLGGPVNLQEAYRLYQVSSDHMVHEGMLRMALYHLKHGNGKHGNAIMAWFKAAAEHGNTATLEHMINLYFDTEHDITYDISYVLWALEKALTINDHPALRVAAEDVLLNLYALGIDGVIEPQFEKLEEVSLDLLEHNPKALVFYGEVLWAKGLEAEQRAYLEQGVQRGWREAKEALALALAGDRAIEKDPKARWQYITLLRDLTDVPYMQFLISLLFLKPGPYIEPDYERFKYWLELAAQNNEGQAYHVLALQYNYGQYGYPKDYSKALLCMEKAIELGFEDKDDDLQMIRRNMSKPY